MLVGGIPRIAKASSDTAKASQPAVSEHNSEKKSPEPEEAGVQPEMPEDPEISDYSDEDVVIDDSEPDSESEPTGIPDDPEGGLTETRYIMSRFTGTFIGFGLGHLIQGRWLNTGWIYTIGNLLTYPVVTWIWPLYGRGKNYRAGVASWAVVHGIEVWDVWSHDTPDLSDTDDSASIRPLSFWGADNRYYGLLLSWKF